MKWSSSAISVITDANRRSSSVVKVRFTCISKPSRQLLNGRIWPGHEWQRGHGDTHQTIARSRPNHHPSEANMQNTLFALRQIGVISLIALCIALPTDAELVMIWTLSEFQPNIAAGGRANSIAVNPGNARDLCGFRNGWRFRSNQARPGPTWVRSHLRDGDDRVRPGESERPHRYRRRRLRRSNLGGIWRSVDGGTTWTHVPNPPAPAGISDRFSAGAVSIAPDTGKIFVATSFGISYSSDQGATWNTSQPFAAQRVASLVALPGDLILAGGASGVKRSLTAGSLGSGPALVPAASLARRLRPFPVRGRTCLRRELGHQPFRNRRQRRRMGKSPALPRGRFMWGYCLHQGNADPLLQG